VAQDRVARKLAAILAADVVGYSRLMEADEAGTLARLKALRAEFLNSKVTEYGGRIVKTTGDGTLIEFPSAVGAVQHAIEVQREMARRNAAQPQGLRIELRMGINLGDVIIDGDDIYGDGVNVAARLEGLAEPGGICVSDVVHRSVAGKVDARFDDMGAQALKNIKTPVQAFRVSLEGGNVKLRPMLTPADRPSIIVLPFANMSGDPEQEYFSDGISEDVITDLSKLPGLTVIARNSSFVYKGKHVNLQQVGRELGVRYVLEGSVRKSGNRIRVTAQLIDATTASHIWADRYDRELSDIFAVQDELTGNIVAAIAPALRRDAIDGKRRRPTDNLEAYELFLRGREQHWRVSRTGSVRARELFNAAIVLDPHFAAAYAFLGFGYLIEYINGWGKDPDASLAEALALAKKATQLDEKEPHGHFVLAGTHLWMRDLDRSRAEAERVLELDPNFALAHTELGMSSLYSGRPDDAIQEFERSLQLDPHHLERVAHSIAQAHYNAGRFEEAASWARRRIDINSETDSSRVLLAACYGQLGRHDDARAAWQGALRINPEYSLERRRRILPYKDPAVFERLVEGLRKAGIKEST
jgi:adenylate cyclase